MKCFARERAGDCTVGTDQPEVEAELLGDGQSEGVAASGDEDDFDPGGVGSTQGRQIIG